VGCKEKKQRGGDECEQKATAKPHARRKHRPAQTAQKARRVPMEIISLNASRSMNNAINAEEEKKN
jgi:hypothetical protein